MSDAPAGTRSPHFTRDATAQTYRDIQMPRIFVPWARALLEIVPPRAGDAVLEVATGPGTVARQAALLAGPAGRVTGLDISAAMLSVGRSWPAEAGAAPIEYLESSASSMPLPDASFDVVYCQQGMQHMSDPLAALREMGRLLKPGGRLGLAGLGHDGDRTVAESRGGARVADADRSALGRTNGCDRPHRSPDAGQGCCGSAEWLAASVHDGALRRRGIHGTTRAPQGRTKWRPRVPRDEQKDTYGSATWNLTGLTATPLAC